MLGDWGDTDICAELRGDAFVGIFGSVSLQAQ